MTTALATLASNPGALESLDDPAERMIQVCTRAKEWLALALDSDDIEKIAEVKSQAEALRVYAIQKQYGKDAELSAQELVRRAERGIGVAIRLGQERGEIETPREAKARAGKARHQHPDNTGVLDQKPRPTDFVSYDDLSSNGAGIYHLTDDVADDQFNEAIEEAKTERNLSRANVVRKIKAKKNPHDVVIDPAPPKKNPGRPGSRRSHLQMLDVAASQLGGMQLIFDDISQLDETVTLTEARRLSSDIAAAIRSLSRINALIKERAQ